MTDDVLHDLEKWTRKYRHVKIVAGGFMQPGDGWNVSLIERGGKHVEVGEYDIMVDEDGCPTATITDLIREALKQWNEKYPEEK